jgi:predicted RNase H-like HicB family nuclease
MFAEYIQAALERATYEIIDDPEPFYGEVPELQGVWATGKTLEECRKELQSVIEGWIALKLRLGHPIPPIGGHAINVSAEPVSIVE